MRTILSILIMFPGLAAGQTSVNNFHIEGGKVIWTKVIPATSSFTELITALKRAGIFESYEITGNSITGELKPFPADYKGSGYSEMMTPMYVSRSHWRGFVVIDYADGHYTVTLKNIRYVTSHEYPVSKLGEVGYLE